MGRRCCIEGCNSRSSVPEHHGVTFHSYPLDASTRAIWIRNTRLSSARNITKSVLVCSRHFRRADFQPMKSGKYLLKQRVFPTVFPWGKLDANAINEEVFTSAPSSTSSVAAETKPTKTKVKTEEEINMATSSEPASPSTVEAKVAQIMAETAELSASIKKKALHEPMAVDTVPMESGKRAANETMTDEEPAVKQPNNAADVSMGGAVSPGIKFEPVTVFNPGVRLEAQDFDGVWHSARVVEVDNDDREVLIKFEKVAKNKSLGSEEWIPMNSTRLRQKVSTKPIPVFDLEDKVMARWSGPRRFPGTVKKILENDMYEVLFDDGFVKNVRAIHMNRIQSATTELSTPPQQNQKSIAPSSSSNVSTPAKSSLKVKRPILADSTPLSSNKSKRGSGQRKDWPLLQMDKLDLDSLNLPEIPKDGEWTCHWVNDQPIGKEGFLIVGEHKKPTVIVEDWRLPPGWIKHMYQRSNVLGKWDVILVSPEGKRFRSKADLKTYLEDQGRVYNPDIYDFSIHRRRAKDINAYVFTPDYVPQQYKPKSVEMTLNVSVSPKETKPEKPVASTASVDKSQFTSSALASSSLKSPSTSHYIEPPEVTLVPPMELMTSPTISKQQQLPEKALEDVESTSVATSADSGFAYIGGLKVQIVDNLFRCPQEGCSKNFRKENHLQIHVKHYHQGLIKLLGSCPKMQELAEKRTLGTPDINEPAPRNQIPNQQFFAKLHQQDLEQSRSHRRTLVSSGQTTSTGASSSVPATGPVGTATKTSTEIQKGNDSTDGISTPKNSKAIVGDHIDNSPRTDENKMVKPDGNLSLDAFNTNTTASNTSHSKIISDSSMLDVSATSTADGDFIDEFNTSSAVGLPPKRPRLSPHKRPTSARKSNRQRTTRRYLTAAQATAGAPHHPAIVTADSTSNDFGTDDFEETRHSFNATPDAKVSDATSSKKRKQPTTAMAPATPLSSLDSPVTADSGSSSFLPQPEDSQNNSGVLGTPQYIKENGELIKIVRMRQEEIINCLCSYGEEDGLMIQCELCLCWQHGSCNGIEKESDVPDKYVCYICRNPQRGRESMRYKHDQDWLYEGKLPVANYHNPNPGHAHRFELLKKSHTLSGNLVELKRFMHSLQVKINIANNKYHPKMYLWAKKWDEEELKTEDNKETDELGETTIKVELQGSDTHSESDPMKSNVEKNDQQEIKTESDAAVDASAENIKAEPSTVEKVSTSLPKIPQPEAAIEPDECQHRLLDHIKIQQNRMMERLLKIETEIDDLEKMDTLPDLKDADLSTTKDVISSFIKELDIMKQIAKVNALEHAKQAMAADHSILIKS